MNYNKIFSTHLQNLKMRIIVEILYWFYLICHQDNLHLKVAECVEIVFILMNINAKQ